MKIQFLSAALQQSDDNLKKFVVSQEQRELFDAMMKIMLPKIERSQLAFKEFI